IGHDGIVAVSADTNGADAADDDRTAVADDRVVGGADAPANANADRCRPRNPDRAGVRYACIYTVDDNTSGGQPAAVDRTAVADGNAFPSSGHAMTALP